MSFTTFLSMFIIVLGGGVVARVLFTPLTKQAISDWKKSKSGVPPSRVLIVAKLLKLQPHDIRPDIFPPPGRSRKRHLKSGNHNHAQQRSVL